MPPDVAGVEVVEEADVTRDPGQEDQDVEDQAGQQLRLVAGKMFSHDVSGPKKDEGNDSSEKEINF